MDSTPEKSKEDSILFNDALNRNRCHNDCHLLPPWLWCYKSRKSVQLVTSASLLYQKERVCTKEIAVQKIVKWNVQIHQWCNLTKSLQWSTLNWRNSQRWLSPRAAAHASTPHPHLACLLPTNSLSLSGHSLHPWHTAIGMEDLSFFPPFQLSDFSE